jgi:hypothetical protein
MPGNQRDHHDHHDQHEHQQHHDHHHHHDDDNDNVPPRDEAERRAAEYEDAHHERSGAKKSNETPSHQGKPKSVRQGE